MTYEHELTVLDMIAARDAMESWEDAFKDDEPDAAVKVRKTIEAFNVVIDMMNKPERPKLQLVKREEEEEK